MDKLSGGHQRGVVVVALVEVREEAELGRSDVEQQLQTSPAPVRASGTD
jgi:hypothetical protein